MNNRLEILNEPFLLFDYNQKATDPRDGLTLFGPYSKKQNTDFKIGIIGTRKGVLRMKTWLIKFMKPNFPLKPDIAKPFYPGFEAVFHNKPNLSVIKEIFINQLELEKYYKYSDPYVRVNKMVESYEIPLRNLEKEEGNIVDLWFVIIPEQVFQLGKIRSKVLGKDVIKVGIRDEYSRRNPGLFDEIDDDYKKLKEAYLYENHFHNQLKLKLLQKRILTQIVRETTIAYDDDEFKSAKGKPKRDLSLMETDVLWNIATSTYYKVGGIPWKLGNIRENVCYIGLVFKRDERNVDAKYACCAAQMFLDSGDGMVFKGAMGPWYNDESKEYHLTKEAAMDLLSNALKSFSKYNNDKIPTELFIHGKTTFDNEEWEGFQEAVKEYNINLVGVIIKDEKVFKLYREYDFPILRGSIYIVDNYNAFLWTKGFIPRLQQPIGMETPNPLSIKVIRGKGRINIKQVCKDILSLTKLNYNSCKFCDGIPVTLKFANAIGEILTAGPIDNIDILLPFRYYI